MMARPTSLRLAASPRILYAWWLLACAVLLRALIPVGFMPDDAALKAGRLALMLCPQAGTFGAHAEHGKHARHGSALGVAAIDAAGAEPIAPYRGDDSASHADAHATGLSCPFWLTAQAAWPAPAVPAVIAAGAVLLWRLPKSPQWAPPARRLASGPPVGPRAPPHHRVRS
ncbi:MAG: hypothetical protein JHC61_01845 [Burkholderiaceae bacterium]|nr:hypothetical protein [Burkholderiaceae bacterium]